MSWYSTILGVLEHTESKNDIILRLEPVLQAVLG